MEKASPVITLDAGHGCKLGSRQWTGAHGNGIQEDVWALDMAQILGHWFRAYDAKVVFTRSDDSTVDLKERGRTARNAGSDVFISIHLNANAHEIVHGAEVYCAKNDVRSKDFALPILGQIQAEGMHNGGVRWDSQSQYPSLTVLQTTYHNMRSMLIEFGYLTNPADAAMLKNAHWKQNVAQRIAKTVLKQLDILHGQA